MEESNTIDFPKLTIENILELSFNNWYPKFKNISLKGCFIKLDSEVVKYLNSDRIFLPEDDESEDDEDGDDSDDGASETSDLDENEETNIPNLEELKNKVDGIIDLYGGTVFPKLNWSSPKDAVWITLQKNLKCSNLNDILLVLKSSDSINHDLNRAFLNCTDYSEEFKFDDYYLVLKEWYDLNHAMEFRCFVVNNQLKGVCQRDYNHYPFLVDLQDNILTNIEDFFNNNLKDKLNNANYVFDVYQIKKSGTIKLVDLNPINDITEPLLFEWDEILKDDGELEIRVIESESEANYSRATRYLTNQFPQELTATSYYDSLQQLSNLEL